MKKIIAILIAVMMCASLAACAATPDTTDTPTETTPATTAPAETTAPAATGDSVAHTLKADFQAQLAANPDATAQEIADTLITNPVILFMPMTMPVEQGLLSGFENAEITGFDRGVMFGPAMGTIPFIGYIFDLSEGTDAEAFMQTLSDNANLRWNICTEADEMVVDCVDNTVFFIMAPTTLEQ